MSNHDHHQKYARKPTIILGSRIYEQNAFQDIKILPLKYLELPRWALLEMECFVGEHQHRKIEINKELLISNFSECVANFPDVEKIFMDRSKDDNGVLRCEI